MGGGEIPSAFQDLSEGGFSRKHSSPEDGEDGSNSDQTIYFPKPSNEEQRRIIEKLRSTNGVLVQGPPGTGKTHLAVSLGREAIRQNYNVQFVTAATLVAMLAKAHNDGTLDKQLTILSRPKLLIIDELGYLPFEANAAHLFFQLVSRRYEKGSILITSNRSVGEWGSVFGDPVVATAILDRLLHHSTVITIRGDSYRLREKRRSGLLQKAGTALETNETANQ